MLTSVIDTELDQLLRLQRGLATFAQLADAGVPREQARRRLRESWNIVLPNVVATFPGRLDPSQRLVAAQLYAGGGALISGSTAAAWHGVTSAATARVHVE